VGIADAQGIEPESCERTDRGQGARAVRRRDDAVDADARAALEAGDAPQRLREERRRFGVVGDGELALDVVVAVHEQREPLARLAEDAHGAGASSPGASATVYVEPRAVHTGTPSHDARTSPSATDSSPAAPSSAIASPRRR